MKHRGDNMPSGAFTLEEQPNKEGFVLARFYENVQPFSETHGEVTISGYEYDEYYLELEDYGGLADDITANYAGFLAQAKLAEAENVTIPELQNRLESELTDVQLAIVEVYELIVGGGVS